MPGWVPAYEEYAAMRYTGYNESEWPLLHWGARARAVAHYRLSILVDLHRQDAVTQAMKGRH